MVGSGRRIRIFAVEGFAPMRGDLRLLSYIARVSEPAIATLRDPVQQLLALAGNEGGQPGRKRFEHEIAAASQPPIVRRRVDRKTLCEQRLHVVERFAEEFATPEATPNTKRPPDSRSSDADALATSIG